MKILVIFMGIFLLQFPGLRAFEADKDLANEIMEDVTAKSGLREGMNPDGTVVAVARVEIPANTHSENFAMLRILAYEQAIMEALVQVAKAQSGVGVQSTVVRKQEVKSLSLGIDFTKETIESLPDGSSLQGLEIIRTGEHCPKDGRCVAIAIARNDPKGYQFARAAALGNDIEVSTKDSAWANFETLAQMTDQQLLYTQGMRKGLKGNKPVIFSMASAAVQFDTPSGLEIAKSMAESKARQQIALFLESSVGSYKSQTSTATNRQVNQNGKSTVMGYGKEEQLEESRVQTKAMIRNTTRLRSVCGKHPLATAKTCLVLLAWEGKNSTDRQSQSQQGIDAAESEVKPHQGKEHVGIGL